MMRYRLAVLLVLLGSATVSAQQDELQTLLDRMDTYLAQYERALGEIVADESFRQRTIPGIPADLRGTGISPKPSPSVSRQLQSTVSFIRLPGGAAWLGIRAVRMVDRRPVPDSDHLLALLAKGVADAHAQAVAIVQASAQHHLGNPRTINMPTLPLELLDRRHRDRLVFQLDRRDTIRGVRTMRISFEEKGRPTLIQGNGGRDVISRGVVWIDFTSGAVWRAQVFYRDYAVDQGAVAPEPRIDVEFAEDRQLRMLVPQRMREIFLVNSGRGEGEARYSNFRRFTTSARLVPQR